MNTALNSVEVMASVIGVTNQNLTQTTVKGDLGKVPVR
jgi:hypothetical protein